MPLGVHHHHQSATRQRSLHPPEVIQHLGGRENYRRHMLAPPGSCAGAPTVRGLTTNRSCSTAFPCRSIVAACSPAAREASKGWLRCLTNAVAVVQPLCSDAAVQVLVLLEAAQQALHQRQHGAELLPDSAGPAALLRCAGLRQKQLQRLPRDTIIPRAQHCLRGLRHVQEGFIAMRRQLEACSSTLLSVNHTGQGQSCCWHSSRTERRSGSLCAHLFYAVFLPGRQGKCPGSVGCQHDVGACPCRGKKRLQGPPGPPGCLGHHLRYPRRICVRSRCMLR
jgi:hypothetical protein